MKYLSILGYTLITGLAFSQEPDTDTTVTASIVDTTISEEPASHEMLSGMFVATRIINGHSTETLTKGTFEYRIEHRFGDIAGTNGGAQQFYGFDNAADIRMAFEYGITDKLMAGFGRSKGTGRPYRSLLDGFLKLKLIEQSKGFPVSATAMVLSTYTYMKKSDNIYDIAYFPKQINRFAYATEISFSRYITKRFSAALIPTFVYRNYVAANDVNGLFSLGGALKYGVTPQMAVIIEYYQNMNKSSIRQDNTNSLGVAVEWITFGHFFTINLTNSKGFTETQFIPYTFEKWNKGQFRLGFTICRKF